VCRSKHVQQLRNIGIINSTTGSHLVGYFYMICFDLLRFIEVSGDSSRTIKAKNKDNEVFKIIFKFKHLV